MTVSSNDMKIVLTDETSDGRFLKSNTGDNILKTATETKTEKVVSGASTPSTAKTLATHFGQQGIDKVSGGATGFATNLMSNPVTIAVAAISFAKYAFDKVQDINNRLNQVDDLRMRAGGAGRGEVNQHGLRRNIFGRNTTSGFGSYIRR